MPIHRVEDDMPVEANAIYLIPPRKDLVLTHDTLHLTDLTSSERGLHLPIDTFFESLAAERGDRAIGIILSGTGSDGTRGIRVIQEAGGMVMVQDAATAQFDGMPRSALATGLGACEGVVVTCIDITHVKQAEAAVWQSQAQVQEILDHAPAAIYVKDTTGHLRLVNHQFEALLGLPSDQLLDKTVHDLHAPEVAATLASHDAQVLASNTPMTFEETAVTADGMHTFLSVKFPLHDAAGSPYALCGIATDMTARKQAEEALREANDELEWRVQELSQLTSILEATPDLVAIANTQEQIV